MIKRTPQEIADFFGCYVARDADRRWHIFKEKPELELGYHRKENGIYLNPKLINTDNVYQLAVLYEPHSDNKDSSCYSKQTDSDNKDSANSCEVSKNQYKPDYHTITAPAEIDMEEFEQGVMVWIERGWKPSGGISFDKRGCPHQVVVRGL